MTWTPSFSPGTTIGSTVEVVPTNTSNPFVRFSSGFTGTYQTSGYSDACYKFDSTDANGNDIWEFFITRRLLDGNWLGLGNTPNFTIKHDGTSWADENSVGNPTHFVQSGSTVSLYEGDPASGGILFGSFTDPYYTAPPSGGGGGGFLAQSSDDEDDGVTIGVRRKTFTNFW